MKKYLKHFVLASLCCLFVICSSVYVTKAETTSQQLQGGDSKETAVDIQLNTTYEAIVPLTEKNGKYSGETWYKFSLPPYAHHFALVLSSTNYGDIVPNNATWAGDIGGVEIDDQTTGYYTPNKGCDVYYLHAESKSPEAMQFKVVPIINPTSEDGLSLNFNQEYKEAFYTRYSSTYEFTAPYTGKYRIYYNLENGREASYTISYYTGQTVARESFNDSGSSVVDLKAGIKYIVRFSGEDSTNHLVVASYYISDPLVDSITVDKKEITLKKSEQYQLATTVLPEKAVDTSVSYSTSNKKVALVTADGCITAVGPGTATITIDSNDGSGVQTKCKVTVPSVKVTRLDLNTTKLVIDKKGSYKIKATTYPTRADNRSVTFKSSNSKIVAVDKKTGKLTPKKAGTVTITCTTNDGSKISKKCKVTVKSSYFKKKSSGKNYNSKITEKSVRKALV